MALNITLNHIKNDEYINAGVVNRPMLELLAYLNSAKFLTDVNSDVNIDASNIVSGTIADARLPLASTTQRGIVQLDDNLDSNSNSKALTSRQGYLIKRNFKVTDTADSYVLRNSSGTTEFSTPSNPKHPLRLADVTDNATPLSVVGRNSNGTTKFSPPTHDQHPLRRVDIVDNLTSTSTTKPLSANQGKILSEMISGSGDASGSVTATPNTLALRDSNGTTEFSAPTSNANPLRRGDVVDNVTSTTTTQPLSANQGKILNDKIVDNERSPESIAANANTLALRNSSGTTNFSTPSNDAHPLRQGDVVDDLNSELTNRPLSAKQGRILNDKIVNAYGSTESVAATADTVVLRDGDGTSKFTAPSDNQHPLRQGDVVNNLTSTAGNRPLSANQGRILDDKISDNVRSPESTNATANTLALRNSGGTTNFGVPTGSQNPIRKGDVRTYQDILNNSLTSGANEDANAASAFSVYQILDSLVSSSGFNLIGTTPGASFSNFTGYFSLPSGLLVQFGRALINASMYTTVSLPTAFKSVNRYTVITSEGNGSGAWENAGIATIAAADADNATPSSFRIYGKFIDDTGVIPVEALQTVSWVALGESP